MKEQSYRSMPPENAVGRRDFLKAGGAIGAGLVLTGRSLLAAQQTQDQRPPAKPAAKPPKPKTNIEDALKVPNLDTYIEVTGDRDDGFDFVDFQSKKGIVVRSGRILDIRFGITD